MTRRIALAVVAIILAVGPHAFAQEQSPDSAAAGTDSSHVSTAGLAIIGGVTVGGFIYGHALQTNLWWKGERSAFHFDWSHDWTYALGSDKFGHAYFPYLMSSVYSQAFLASGIDSATSHGIATGIALTYQTYIEIRDGFSKEWGFSWGDFGADVIGAAYPLLQSKSPLLRNISPKISFYPSQAFRDGAHRAIIDDYESTYDWLSIDLHNMLPEGLGNYVPAWINLAVGHSVKGIDGLGGGHHEWYLSLDWNLDGLPGDGWFRHLLRHNLNFYHFPAPAVRISPGVVWYGIHF